MMISFRARIPNKTGKEITGTISSIQSIAKAITSAQKMPIVTFVIREGNKKTNTQER